MKFDHARSSKKLSELLDYLACFAIGCGVAAVLGISWLLGFALVVWGFKYWKKRHPFLESRLRVLTILAFCLLSLVGNWSAYRDGVSVGYDAAAGSGKGRANQSLLRNADKASAFQSMLAARRGRP